MPPRRRRPRPTLVGFALALALAVTALVAPGAAVARTTDAVPAAGAGTAAATGVDRPATRKPRSCLERKRHRRAVVTARHGKQAGKQAGRRAYRRCVASRPVEPVPPTTPVTPTTPTTSPATTPTTTPTTPGSGQVSGSVVVTDGCLTSVPDPGTTTPVQICWTLFQPRGSGSDHRVPLVMHSHGWGGSRTTDPAGFAAFLDAGYGVLSFDQRGFGQSGGQAYVENPDVEGHDVLGLVDLVAGLPWVQQDGPGDPRMAAIGGSYGGGYQFLAAFEALRLRGKPLFDALAPEITWNDLRESLAPSDVVRLTWTNALVAAGVPTDALPSSVLAGLAQGVLENGFPASLVDFFAKNGPQFHTAAGRRLDIPVLLGQGTTDSLFPLEQGFQNFQAAITDRARAQSIFVGYNGGHVLPAVYPGGINVTSDPCSAQLGGGTFQALSVTFFDEQLKGLSRGLTGYGRYHLATPGGRCVTVDSVGATRDASIAKITALSGPAGPQTGSLVAAGPISIAGTPSLTASVSSLVADSRTFLGLAVGTSAATATLVQDNVLPLRLPTVVTGARQEIALPSVAVDVPAGQNLYLIAAPSDTIFTGMGARVPGTITLEQATVHLPVVPAP